MRCNFERNNFDFLRLLFAGCVLLVHTFILSQSPVFSWIPRYFNSQIAIESFFVISGYLVYMSYDKSSSLQQYFSKRFRRIYPAYFSIIILAAILGIFLSRLNYYNYFFNINLLKYILANLIFLNFIHPDLPGVFTQNYLTAVNGALWTIKIEVCFYLIIPLLAYFIKKYKSYLVLLLIYIIAVGWVFVFNILSQKTGKLFYLEISRQLPGQLSFFAVGIFAYCYKNWVKKYRFILLILALSGLLLNDFMYNLIYLFPVILGSIIIYISFFAVYFGNFGKYGDISYGVYIFHFPTLQVFVSLKLFKYAPILSFFTAVMVIIFFAFLSWHLIEKRFLLSSSHYKMTIKS